MKLTKLSTITLVSILGLAGMATSAQAVVPGTSGDTTATAELTEGDNGGAGALALMSVPSFEFGSQAITDQPLTFNVAGTSPTVVSDLRGDGSGWNLKANITDFTDSTKTLAGAVFTLPTATATTTGQGVAPTVTGASLTDSDATIINAEADKGMGSWSVDHDVQEATLAVPAGNYAGSYTATITWTLGNAPA